MRQAQASDDVRRGGRHGRSLGQLEELGGKVAPAAFDKDFGCARSQKPSTGSAIGTSGVADDDRLRGNATDRHRPHFSTAGHHHIDDGELRVVLRTQLGRTNAVGCLPDDLEMGVVVDESGKALPNLVVIICDDDTERSRRYGFRMEHVVHCITEPDRPLDRMAQ